MKAYASIVALLLAVAGGFRGVHAAELQPFVASYAAFNAGKAIGSATMRVQRSTPARWRIDLDIAGNRGLAGIAGLDIAQSTVFEQAGDHYRPLSQSTRRKALFFGRSSVGTYDWAAGIGHWTGDVKASRQQAVALQQGDMSGLLINLAILRDAAPGKELHYRYVDGGRVRAHRYLVSSQAENILVGDLSYEALRVSRSNGGDDETIVWVADGVPTPVRILQRQDGRDGIDLRLTAYQGVP
ncbi:DUF3108 domain-containing protein [soil metagenome]